MPLTRFLRRLDFTVDQGGTSPSWDRAVTIQTGLSTNTKRCWSLQRLEFNPNVRLEGDGMVAANGNVGYAWHVLMRENDSSGRTLCEMMQAMNRRGGATDVTMLSGTGRFPMIHEFPKGLVTVAPALWIWPSMFNVDSITGGWIHTLRLYYTVLELDTDDLIFLRSFQ